MIKAIIFDCFGVVLSDGLRENYNHFGGDFDKDLPFIAKLLHEVSSGRIKSSVPAMAKKLGISESQWQMHNENSHNVDLELLDYADELKKKYKLAMLSNVGSGGLGRFFEPGLLERYFDPIVESAAIGYAKPEAQAYEYVADKLGIRLDECVMIDDRPEYIDGAKAIGMKGVVYTSLDQLKIELSKILNRDKT